MSQNRNSRHNFSNLLHHQTPLWVFQKLVHSLSCFSILVLPTSSLSDLRFLFDRSSNGPPTTGSCPTDRTPSSRPLSLLPSRSARRFLLGRREPHTSHRRTDLDPKMSRSVSTMYNPEPTTLPRPHAPSSLECPSRTPTFPPRPPHL